MNFDDIFRSFIGKYSPSSCRYSRDDAAGDDNSEDPFQGFTFFSHPPGPFHHGWFDGSDDDGDDDVRGSEGPPGRQGPFPEGGLLFSFDSEVNEMFKHFNEMFKNFGLADFPPLDVPRIDQIPSQQPESRAPRDQMLKAPDSEDKRDPATPLPSTPAREPLSWFDELRRGKTSLFVPPDTEQKPAPARKKDSDLDDLVRRREMDKIFRGRSPWQRGPDDPQQPQFRSFSRSTSIQTIRKPDGTIETKRTERDGNGTETTTVTISKDDAPLPAPRGAGPLGPRHGLPWGCRHKETPLFREREQDDRMYQKFFGSWFKK